jgi:hypothetical protein
VEGTAVFEYEGLPRHFPGGTKKNNEKFIQDTRFLIEVRMGQWSPVYETEVLFMWLRCRMSQHYAYVINIIIIINFITLGPLLTIERYLRKR